MYLIREKDKKIKRRNTKEDLYTKQIFVFLFLRKKIRDVGKNKTAIFSTCTISLSFNALARVFTHVGNVYEH